MRRIGYITRFTLEAATALSIGTGSPDGRFDTALVRDANGLPMIPGTTLAGVLRHLCEQAHGVQTADRLFGHVASQRSGTHDESGEVSRVQVATGCLLDSQQRPVEGLLLGESLKTAQRDPLLSEVWAQVEQPVSRERVRITARGAAADQGKFDRTVLPAGHRFACEVTFWADADTADEQDWQCLLGLLCSPRLRLGGATRSGLGRMQLVVLAQGRFDLADPGDARRFRALGRGIADADGLTVLPNEALKPSDDPQGDWVELVLSLKAKDFWRTGVGNEALGRYKDERTPDELPLLEEHIIWGPGGGEVAGRTVLIPGASVKGALSHRVAYYDNCLRANWADDNADVAAWDKSSDTGSPAVRSLFGFCKDDADGDADAGKAGSLFVDDVGIAIDRKTVSRMMHNVIDRFTGGVRDRLLFSEELLWQTGIELRLLLNLQTLDATTRQALRLAIEDLLQGRLPLGAASNRGHGRFEGEARPGLDRVWTQEEMA